MCDTLSKNRINSIFSSKPAFPQIEISETDNTQRKTPTPDLKLESERLKTFENWDNNSVTPQELAKVGLYYSPPSNKVKCAFCSAEASPCSLGECALDDHLKLSPFCPFARSKKGQRTLSTFLRDLPQGQDVCGNVDTFTDTVRFLSKIVHPYDDYNSRLQSFETWGCSKQKPEELAEAGFYYRGEGDKTVCFCCSGPLQGWDDEDIPWEQHALWFPKCKFVLEEKGGDFVEQVHKKLKPGPPNLWDVCEDGPSTVDEDKLCVVCCTSQKGAVLVPCGHDWTCVKCIGSLEDKKCPICREQIVNVRKL